MFELVLPVHGSEQIVSPSHTTVDQKLPANWEDKKLSLLNFVKSLIEKKKYTEGQIIKMDEVLLTFEIYPTRTVYTTREKTTSMLTIGNEKTSFTCVLSCAANCDKLKKKITHF